MTDLIQQSIGRDKLKMCKDGIVMEPHTNKDVPARHQTIHLSIHLRVMR